MSTIPDGYERWGEQGLVLIDPDWCPTGHPFAFGQRLSNTLCRRHGHHHAWLCACGQRIWRVPGAFVDQLDCD